MATGHRSHGPDGSPVHGLRIWILGAAPRSRATQRSSTASPAACRTHGACRRLSTRPLRCPLRSAIACCLRLWAGHQSRAVKAATSRARARRMAPSSPPTAPASWCGGFDVPLMTWAVLVEQQMHIPSARAATVHGWQVRLTSGAYVWTWAKPGRHVSAALFNACRWFHAPQRGGDVPDAEIFCCA